MKELYLNCKSTPQQWDVIFMAKQPEFILHSCCAHYTTGDAILSMNEGVRAFSLWGRPYFISIYVHQTTFYIYRDR